MNQPDAREPNPFRERRVRSAGPVTRKQFLVVTGALAVAVVALAAALITITLTSRPGTDYFDAEGKPWLSEGQLKEALKQADRNSGKTCFAAGTTEPYLSANGNRVVDLAPYAFCGDGDDALAYGISTDSNGQGTADDEPEEGTSLYGEYAEGKKHFRP